MHHQRRCCPLMKPVLALISPDFRNPWTPGKARAATPRSIRSRLSTAPDVDDLDRQGTDLAVYKQILDGVITRAALPSGDRKTLALRPVLFLTGRVRPETDS